MIEIVKKIFKLLGWLWDRYVFIFIIWLMIKFFVFNQQPTMFELLLVIILLDSYRHN